MAASSIPKVIHRVWIGGPMPPEFAGYGDQWAALNPGWGLRLWGEADIDDLGLVNRELYDQAPTLCPERYVPRFRSNLVRYEIMARHGGVYVDTDLVPLAPLPDLAGVEAFAGWEQQGTWIGNSILGSTPGHGFFARLVDGAPASVAAHRGQRSPISTGPQYLTRQWRHDPGGLHVFDEHLFYPQSWRDLDNGEPPDLTGAVAHHLWAAKRGQVSVVIPYRSDGAERDRNLAWVLDRLGTEHPDWQVVVERDDTTGHFNRSALLRTGVARSFGDVIVCHDADVWAPDLPAAVDQVRAGTPWALPHVKVRRLTDDATAKVLAGAELHRSLPLAEQAYRGCMTGGAAVVDRATFHAVPPDDRFEGWGGEDESWGWALATMAGDPWRSNEPLWHLWHPPQPRLTRSIGNAHNDTLRQQYRQARGDKAAMRRVLRAAAGGVDPGVTRQAWRNTQTGRIRMVRVGSNIEGRYLRRPEWVQA